MDKRRCDRCGYQCAGSQADKLFEKHVCDVKVQERSARAFWATVERDLDQRGGGR